MPPTGLATRVLTRSTESARYDVRASSGTPVPKGRELHMLTRMGAGYTPKGLKQLRKAGSPKKWFEKQLDPASIKESASATALKAYFPRMAWSPAVKWARDREGVYGGWQHARDLGNLSLLRRIYSNRQVLEQMVDFWSNHLHVPAGMTAPGCTARPTTTCSAVTRSRRSSRCSSTRRCTRPCSSISTTTRRPRAPRTRTTVASSSSCTPSAARRDTPRHGQGLGEDPVRLHRQRGDLDGYYDPATAHDRAGHCARLHAAQQGRRRSRRDGRLSPLPGQPPGDGPPHLPHARVRFVSDKPSDALVNSMAKVYLKSGTDIKAVLRAPDRLAEFWGSAWQEGAHVVRRPGRHLSRAGRPLAQADQRRVVRERDQLLARRVRVYQWPAPDGAPDTAAAWTSVSRMLNSFQLPLELRWWLVADEGRHLAQAAPTGFRRRRSGFDEFVDHLSRTWLGRRSTPTPAPGCLRSR